MRVPLIVLSITTVVFAALASALAWQLVRDAQRLERLAELRGLPSRDAFCSLAAFAEEHAGSAAAVDAIVDALSLADGLVHPPRPAGDRGANAGTANRREEEIDEGEIIEDPNVIELVVEGPLIEDLTPAPPADVELDAALTRLGACMDRWASASPHDSRLAIARARLERARLGGTRPTDCWLRLRRGAPIFSETMREPLEVRFHAIANPQAAVEPYVDGAPPSPPVARAVVETPRQPIPLPAAGRYVLEVRSVAHHWRRLRKIVVSDLEVVAQVFPECAIVFACVEGRPTAGVAITTDCARSATTGDDGIAMLPLAPCATSVRVDAEYRGASGTHVASIRATLPRGASTSGDGDARGHRDRLSTHTWVDRSAYRPGERIQGRIVVRRHREVRTPTAIGSTAVVPKTTALHGSTVAFEIRFPGVGWTTRNLPLDRWGVAEFAIDVPPTTRLGWVDVRAYVDDGGRRRRLSFPNRQLDIAAYVRPHLLLDVEWPDRPHDWIDVRTRYPSGSSTGRLRGALSYTESGRDREVPFRLDARGRARVRIPPMVFVAKLKHGPVERASVQVTAGNGIAVTESRAFDPPARSAERDDPRRSDELTVRGPAQATVGETVPFTIRGAPDERVLVCVAREAPFAAHAVTLDRYGRGRIEFPIRAAWWPRVHVVAESFREERRATLAFDVVDPAHRIDVRLTDQRDAYAPGEVVTWTVETRDSAARPISASVSVRVIDEAFLGAIPDRFPPLADALRPTWRSLAEHAGRSLPFALPPSAIDGLLVDGRIASPSAVRWLRERRGGVFGGRRGGLRRYGGEGGMNVRRDFRPVALFAPAVITGEDGRATLRFRFPDDLTTWRVTMLAVDASAGFGETTFAVRTNKPVAAHASLPRLLRVGDMLDAPVRIDGNRGVSAGGKVRFATDGALEPADAERGLDEAGDGRPIRLVGHRAGEGAVTVEVVGAAGESLDAVRRSVKVLPRTVARTKTASASFAGRGRIRVPSGNGDVSIAIDDSMDRILSRAAGYLTDYPHGCAEQTCSRMTPILMAHAARRAVADSPVAVRLTEAQRARLEHGMRRLRAMQVADGGFTWWPDRDELPLSETNSWAIEGSDRRMSAIVFRFLARLRDAGVDPARYGVEVVRFAPVFRYSRRRVGESVPDPVDAALVVADLLLHPHDSEARTVAEELLDHEAALPIATVARLGYALARAGRSDAARRVLDRVLQRVRAIDDGGSRSGPGGGATCSLAAVLELAIAVRPDDAALHGRFVRRLVARFSRGRFVNTVGTADAIFALAAVRTQSRSSAVRDVVVRATTGAPFVARVAVGGAPARLRVPADVTELAVDGPRNATLFVTVSRTTTLDAATAPPVAGEWRLERRVTTVWRDGRKIDTARIEVGDVLDVVLELECPGGTDYALIDCPVPAGHEVLPAGSRRGHCIVEDDRVKIPLTHVKGDRVRRTIRLVAAWPGRVTWPPAHAFPMYESGPDAWTGGATLTIDRVSNASAAAGSPRAPAARSRRQG